MTSGTKARLYHMIQSLNAHHLTIPMHHDTLRQLAKNCRRKDCRFLGFPRDWNPGIIEHPNLKGFFLTDSSAWDLIADLIESNHPYEDFYFNEPLGAVGILMKFKIFPDKPPIYIKVQIGANNRAIGRSFHYSDFSGV